MSLTAAADVLDSARGDLLDVARQAIDELAHSVDYAQAFVEQTVEIRIDCLDGERVNSAVELREGVGCLLRTGRAWRYRSTPLTGLGRIGGPATDGLLEELSAAFAYEPVPAASWPVAGATEHRLRSIEDCVVRAYAIADTDGVSARSVDQTVRQRLEAVVTAGGVRYRGMSRRVFRNLDADTHSGASELARTALGHARHAATAAGIGGRRTPVVFGPRAATSFLHELVGHAMEIDNDALGSPYLSGLRRPGAIPRCLTLFDDPTVAGGYGSYAIDDEGTPARRHTLLLEGQYGSPVTTRATAAQHGAPATANGRRHDYTNVAIPRASNTVARSGSDSLADMLSDARDGVLWVECLGSGMINLITGEYSFAGLNCVYVSPGGDRVPVPDVTLVGDALGTLARLEAVGPDFDGDNLTCGKQGQLVGIGVYGPSMRYAALVWNV